MPVAYGMGERRVAYRTSCQCPCSYHEMGDRLREEVIMGGLGAACIRARAHLGFCAHLGLWGRRGCGRSYSYSFSPYTTTHRAVGGRTGTKDIPFPPPVPPRRDYALRRTPAGIRCPCAVPGAVVWSDALPDARCGRADRLAVPSCSPSASNLLVSVRWRVCPSGAPMDATVSPGPWPRAPCTMHAHVQADRRSTPIQATPFRSFCKHDAPWSATDVLVYSRVSDYLLSRSCAGLAYLR